MKPVHFRTPSALEKKEELVKVLEDIDSEAGERSAGGQGLGDHKAGVTGILDAEEALGA